MRSCGWRGAVGCAIVPHARVGTTRWVILLSAGLAAAADVHGGGSACDEDAHGEEQPPRGFVGCRLHGLGAHVIFGREHAHHDARLVGARRHKACGLGAWVPAEDALDEHLIIGLQHALLSLESKHRQRKVAPSQHRLDRGELVVSRIHRQRRGACVIHDGHGDEPPQRGQRVAMRKPHRVLRIAAGRLGDRRSKERSMARGDSLDKGHHALLPVVETLRYVRNRHSRRFLELGDVSIVRYSSHVP
mmetsp:Transcript_14763/g.47080  ORF Transcript_14763/g.47080 Transcript_14763/m.47080 type:complete len:246 (-) Transcript_14763:74-811(-)